MGRRAGAGNAYRFGRQPSDHGSAIALALALSLAEGDARAWRISVSWLVGGHSGVDIHEGRANAVCILARLLREAVTDSGFRLLAIDGGRAHNAIPREAKAESLLSAAGSGRLEAVVTDELSRLRREVAATDPELTVELKPEVSPEGAPLFGRSLALWWSCRPTSRTDRSPGPPWCPGWLKRRRTSQRYDSPTSGCTSRRW